MVRAKKLLASALKSCSQSLSLQRGKRIHACIAQAWDDASTHLILHNTLVDLYAKCGASEDAVHAFLSIPSRDVVSWNAIICGSASCGQRSAALQLFQQMLCEGVAPDRITIICIMKLLAADEAAMLDHRGPRFHAWIAENAALRGDQRVWNSTLDMYCKCGRMQRARRLFDAMPMRNAVSWNVMIAGYARCDDCGLALDLFCAMINPSCSSRSSNSSSSSSSSSNNNNSSSSSSSNSNSNNSSSSSSSSNNSSNNNSSSIEPNSSTFASVLKACSAGSALAEGKLVHACAAEDSLDRDERIACALVGLYGRCCGTIEDARAVFSRSSAKDLATWTTFIGGYVSQGLCAQALDCFEEMRRSGIEPNDVTFLNVIKACANMTSLGHGRRIHGCIDASGPEMLATSVGNALMDMYIKCGSLADARDVFDRMTQRSPVTWSTLIAGDVEHGLHEEALSHFRDMQKEGLAASSVTIAHVLRACSAVCALDQAKLIHAYSVETGIGADILVANTLVYAYVKCGSFADARNAFNDSSSDLDVVAWSAMIAGCSSYRHAIEYFERMLAAGVEPNDVSFVALLSACTQDGCVAEGCHHFTAMMLDYDISASIEHYNCIVDLLARSSRLSDAKMVLSTMPFCPNAKAWTSLLSHSKTLGNKTFGERCFDTVTLANDQPEEICT